MKVRLRLAAFQQQALRCHLYPGDGLEAVALALCGRLSHGSDHWLCLHKIHLVPHEICSRSADRITWPTEGLESLLRQAGQNGMGLLKIHSHPGGFRSFSGFDDESDRDLFESVHGWLDDDLPHFSVVMLPDGTMFGRAIDAHGHFHPIERIAVVGDELQFWDSSSHNVELPAFTQRHLQAFGEGTTQRLRQLRVAVIGCSGTGSPVIEMLVRLGVGELVLVDPDSVEEKNLNRITNSTMADALAKRAKVTVLTESIARIGLGTKVVPIIGQIDDPEIVHQVATCDVVFGCVDSVIGRDTLNRLATFYQLPYFDLGVRLEADGQGGVESVFGSVHYLQPGGASLRTRGVYSDADLNAELLRRDDPGAYETQVAAGYIVGVQEDRPAVISVNTQLAAMAINEFLARLHPYRDDPNSEYAVHRFSLNQGCTYKESDGNPDNYLARHVGRGDARPLLSMPRLSMQRGAL
jgi:hypothetical protein